MQIVSTGDNLHEMSKPVFWERLEKYFNVLSAENFSQSAKCYPGKYITRLSDGLLRIL